MTPALAEARPANRVQAIDSDLLDLTLHDGKKVKLELGGTVTPTPTINRTMEGSSSITIPIYDPKLKFLRGSLGAEDWNAEIDGLWFRYLSTSGTLPNLVLTLEDREVAKIRELTGPLKVLAHRGKPNEVTRAEFIKRLVEEANPALRFICPQLEEVQPIEKQDQADKATENAKERRQPGVGAAKHLKVKGVAATPAQLQLGETAVRVASSVDAPFRVVTALFAALIVESVMGDVTDNVLEAIGSGGAEIADAATEIKNFLTGSGGYGEGGAIGYFKKHPEANFYEIAQGTQRSGAGASTNGAGNYGQFADEAREWAETLTGEEGEAGASSPGARKPPSFEVQKGEDYWSAIQRLAKEVNFRAFVVGANFFYIDELELSRGQVRVAIDADSDIEEVEIDVNRNKPVTEFKFTITAKGWAAPPGSVVTVADYGAASIGFGDAPPKRGEGKAPALSSNRKANGGEGRGRYLVASISAPLTESSDARKIKVTLKKPTAPLPEKAASTAGTSTSTSGSVTGSGGMPAGVAKGIEEADAIDALHYPYDTPGVRGTPPPAAGSGAYDCSGVTSRIAFVICGAPETSLASQELSEFGEPGEGEWFTIYAHGPNGPSGHALSHIKKADGTWWFFGTSGDNPGGGAGWVPESAYDESYLSAFQKRHPKGF